MACFPRSAPLWQTHLQVSMQPVVVQLAGCPQDLQLYSVRVSTSFTESTVGLSFVSIAIAGALITAVIRNVMSIALIMRLSILLGS